MGDEGRPEQLDGWQDYAELKKMLVILGDVVRLNLVHALSRLGEVNVTDLAQLLLISQPLVSWHLSRLRRVGLVRTRRQGRQVYCSLDVERYTHCLQMLSEVVEVVEGSASGQGTGQGAVVAGGVPGRDAEGASGGAPATGQAGPRAGSRAGARPDVAAATGRAQAQLPG